MAVISKREITNRKIAAAVTKKTPEVIKKLEEAAAYDATVEEMCFYAGISTPTYYAWINEDKELSSRIEALRNTPILKARQAAVNKVNESYYTAVDYLSRKRKSEFSQKHDIEHSGQISISKLLDEIEKDE